jgi:hypothetical protein
MKFYRYSSLLLVVLLLLGVTGCKTSSYGYFSKKENTRIEVKEEPDVISYASIKHQEIPSFNDRLASRGLFGPLLGSAVSLATNGIKKMIAKDRARYIANYSFALSDLYFYDQLSSESVFDPAGMQFSGFRLIRTFKDSQDQTDTAFIARFELDTSATNEIINNSIFRLRVTDFQLRKSKIKRSRAQRDNINMDIEITFNSSYVNESGQLFDNVTLGKFYLLLRKAPMVQESPSYAHFYDSLRGTRIDGRSFIVPRSFGYYKDENGNVTKSFSQGAYSISAKVTESANERFVTKVLTDNSGLLIDVIGNKAKSILNKY